MNRKALRPVGLAVVCALAVIFAAATLTTSVETGGEGTGAGGGGGLGASEGDDTDLGGKPNQSGLVDLGKQGELGLEVCVEELNTPLAGWSIVLGLLAIGWFGRRRTSTVGAIGLVTTIAIPVGLVYFLLTSCVTRNGPFGVPEILSGRSSGGGGGSGAADPTAPSVPVDVPLVVYVLVAIGLLAVIVVAVSDRDRLKTALAPVTSRESEDPAERPEQRAGPNATAVGRAAGRAADRIETGTDVENEVYRAWVEMTRHLEVDHPESSTPAEFASAATEAGIEQGDVDELTELFEAVRYGGRAATEDRERRALTALRRIETEYGEGDR